eukprot:COSAG06_NODE_3396_length_5405_cov_6.327554_4_plen_161_part_00
MRFLEATQRGVAPLCVRKRWCPSAVAARMHKRGQPDDGVRFVSRGPLLFASRVKGRPQAREHTCVCGFCGPAGRKRGGPPHEPHARGAASDRAAVQVSHAPAGPAATHAHEFQLYSGVRSDAGASRCRLAKRSSRKKPANCPRGEKDTHRRVTAGERTSM